MRLLVVTLWLAVCGSATAGTAVDSGKLSATVEAMRIENRFPGVAVAAVRKGEVVYKGAFGFASLEHSVPVTDDTVFELASVTKPMTALAVMDLVEEGRIGLNDPIETYVDDVPAAWHGITVEQLLSHMAGLQHRFEPNVDGVLLLENSTARLLAAAKATPMKEAPGAGYNYSDQGYFLLGLVVEKAMGKPFTTVMTERYFAPLGMTGTTLLDQTAIIPHRADGYRLTDGRLERNRRVWQFDLTPHMGVFSSLNDMVRWEQGLVSGRAAPLSVQAKTWQIRRRFDTGKTCDTWGYGRGWFVRQAGGHLFVEHAGYTGTYHLRDVTSGVSVIVLTNRDSPEDPGAQRIAWTVAHAVDPSIPAAQPECWK